MSKTFEQLEPVISALDERIKTNFSAFPTDTADGAIASFSDGADAPVKSLVVGIEPVQDLHGYDAPWPAGGGKNLLPPYSQPSVTRNGVTLTNNNGEYTLNGTASSGVAAFDLRVNFPAGQYTVALNNPTANSNVQIYGIDENIAVPMQVACSTANSATTATFESTVAIFRIRVLRDETVDDFKLSPVFSAGATAATKFYPYSNICPITGWTGAKIEKRGKNLFPTTVDIKSPSVDYESGMITMQPLLNAYQYQVINFPFAGDGETTYTWSFYAYSDIDNAQFSCDGQPDKGNAGLGVNHRINVTTTPQKFTLTGILPKTNTGLRFFRTNANQNVSTATIYIYNIQLELGSTVTDYEPYNPNSETIDISFPTEAGTVYGGSLDVTNGVLVVDRAGIDFSGLGSNTETINGLSCVSFAYVPLKDAAKKTDIMCSHLPFLGNTTVSMTGVGIINRTSNYYNLTFRVNDSVTQKTQFVDWIATNNVQVFGPIATPITYQLTPTEVKSLLGQNNVWADTGDTSVVYRADTSAYIAKKIAEAISALS